MNRPMPALRAQHANAALAANRGDAVAVLQADDERGARVGLVVQGDEIAWAAVDGLLDLALYGRLAHRETAHGGAGGQACAMCAAADAMWTGAIVDQVVRRRGTSATELHARVRAEVGAERRSG